jgi:hypothetical protein
MVQRRGTDSPGCIPAHRPSRHFAAARAAPVEFSHKALFEPNAEAIAAASARAETLAREAAEAVKTADEAKKVAATAMPKRGGRASRQKGNRTEHALVRFSSFNAF